MLGSQAQQTTETHTKESQDTTSDVNQWIKRPPLKQLYDSTLASDPTALFSSLSQKEIGIMHDYLNLWSKNIKSLLDRLKDTIPGEGMIGEVHYWRDMSRILDGINTEVKQPYVEVALQTLAQSFDPQIARSVE
jgi:hypothetical protein